MGHYQPIIHVSSEIKQVEQRLKTILPFEDKRLLQIKLAALRELQAEGKENVSIMELPIC